MEPQILDSNARKLVGMRITTSLSDDKTLALWQGFMPRRHEVKNRKDDGYYSVQVYKGGLNTNSFNDETLFEKWAAIEVADLDVLPEGMESLLLPEGKYAVFLHKGPVSAFRKTATYIYTEWLPKSGFELDTRPHFEFMGARYLGHEHPDSEEEVWVPVR